MSPKWDPIPDHAIEIPMAMGRTYPVLPERLVEVEGRQYVRCEVHGLIPVDHQCEESPGDHLCAVAAHPNHIVGEDHDDQDTSNRQWADTLMARIRGITAMHSKAEAPGGMTSGGCAECDHEWPCPTVHLAKWAVEIHDCWDAGWCHHEGVKVTDPDGDVVEDWREELIISGEADDWDDPTDAGEE